MDWGRTPRHRFWQMLGPGRSAGPMVCTFGGRCAAWFFQCPAEGQLTINFFFKRIIGSSRTVYMKSTELQKSVNSVHLKEPLFSKTYSSTVYKRESAFPKRVFGTLLTRGKDGMRPTTASRPSFNPAVGQHMGNQWMLSTRHFASSSGRKTWLQPAMYRTYASGHETWQ